MTGTKEAPFFPNIPTGEIFSVTHKEEVNGRLVAKKPLVYEGTVINDISLTFQDGRITSYAAANGQKALERLIETDEGSHYLGGIALVSSHSLLAQTNTLFYNTLFDENTDCHIGICNASPFNLQYGSSLSKQALEAAGLNTSLLTVNVTFGTEDMKVMGVKKDWEETVSMKVDTVSSLLKGVAIMLHIDI
ncbi:aminopeptidase [Marinococcus sp. PL1-022]|nr:aminopeptidase [Marinococcus sp. PL1-022]MDX6152646.1 aminopeptidase [Marinococcus sp. PL1-022]